MDKKVIITSDSTCDLPPYICEEFGIKKIGLWVNLGDNAVKDEDGVTSCYTAYEYYEQSGNLAKTSAKSIEEYKEEFAPFVNEGYEVVHVSLSSELSSSYQNACLAAEEVGNVFVVDSRQLSSGQGLVAMKCAELAKEGKSGAEIKAFADEYKLKVSTSFVVDTLKYLSEGGRCSSLAYYGAALMSIKPTIVMPDGALVVGKKYRGKLNKVLKDYVKENLPADVNYETDRIFITHSGMDDESVLEELKELVLSIVPFKQVYINQAGIVIASHCGKNTLGILYVKE